MLLALQCNSDHIINTWWRMHQMESAHVCAVSSNLGKNILPRSLLWILPVGRQTKFYTSTNASEGVITGHKHDKDNRRDWNSDGLYRSNSNKLSNNLQKHKQRNAFNQVPKIFLSTTNEMQRYTIIFIVVSALHVSSGFSAHHQGLKNCTCSIGY